MKRPRGSPPIPAERPPGINRRFRKTDVELAVEFHKRLKSMDVEATLEEVMQVVRREAPQSIVTTLCEAWLIDEERRGVEIVKCQ